MEYSRSNDMMSLSFLRRFIQFGIMKSDDGHGPFVLVNFVIWKVGITFTFSKYNNKSKGIIIYGES